MTPTRFPWRACAASGIVALAVFALGQGAVERAAAEPAPAYALAPLSVGVDSLTPLPEVARAVKACSGACAGIIYLWTPRMPLSRSGIPNVIEAARALGVEVALVSSEELLDYAEGRHQAAAQGIPVVDELLQAGVLAHAPALVVHSGGNLVGTAILGFKSAEAYAALVSRRLSDAVPVPRPGAAGVSASRSAAPIGPTGPLARADYGAVGLPGAYFRWVPGTRLLAYESDRRIYLLDLTDGENRVASGWIDFVPTPDGRYFVTPGPDDQGLEFYVAREVIDAAEPTGSRDVEPIFTDLRMRDQYPSAGILEQSEGRTLYRVLTSWFEGLVYRDYEVRMNPTTGASSVRPVGEPVIPCAGYSLSTPIMSQDGREVAARDESTGTTKIFEILEEGRCREVLDLRAPTSKVAWHASGRKLTFATPRRSRGSPGEQGIFVFDRDAGTSTRVPDSDGASRLAFPEFVGDASVVFLVPANERGAASVFRVVEGLE